jgi:outer membrane protein assembly factor BamB
MKRLAFTAALALSSVALATDWTGLRGPTHDGISTEKIAWPKAGPKQLWRIPIGEGFGTMAVAGGKLFLTAEGGGQEALVALDANTGAAKWHVFIGKSIYEKSGGNGPRTTPATDGKLVVALGTYLNLLAADADTGKTLWRHDLAEEFGGASQLTSQDIKAWGNAASPVIDGDAVLVYGGGDGQTFLAFDKSTGKLLWKSGADTITHAGPTVATIGGVRQVIFLAKSGLVSLDTKTGQELWRHPFKFNVSTASTPVVGGKENDIVYCSAGYDVGAMAVRVTRSADKFATAELWRDTDKEKLVNHWTTPVHKDGYLYGIYGFKKFGTAPLKCVELATGKVMWEKPGFGPGGTILAGDDLVVQGDAGQVAIVKATPTAYQAVGGGTVIDSGKSWNAAVVSNGKLYARTTKKGQGNKEPTGFLVCLDVAAK